MTFEELYENIFEESIPEELLSEAKSDGLYFEGLTLSLSASQELASELQSEDCREFAEEITPICEEWYHKAKKRIPRYRRFAKYWLGASAKIAVKIFARKAGKMWGGRLEQLLKVFRERFLEGVERGVGDSEQFVNTLVEELCTYYVMTALYPTRTNNGWKRVVSLLRYKDANWLNELDVYKFMLILVISGTDITPQNIKLADAVEELVGDMPEKNEKNEEDEEELSELQELDEVLEENLAVREEFNQLERRLNRNREIALAIRKLQTKADKDFCFRYKYQWIGVYEVMCEQHLLPDGEKSTFCRLCNSPENREYFLPEDEDQLPNPYIPGESWDKESTWHQLSSHGDTPKQRRVIEKTKKEFFNLLREQEVI